MATKGCLKRILFRKDMAQVFLQNSDFGLPVRNASFGLYCVAIESNI